MKPTANKTSVSNAADTHAIARKTLDLCMALLKSGNGVDASVTDIQTPMIPGLGHDLRVYH
ncbi:MAG: hypothetical protein M3Q96_05560, partial [Pseudomonadota bacterium]|nr:hypothetical protein [Pseudomonadota bacterium]